MSEIELRVNGRPRRVRAGSRLCELVDELRLDARYLVVEWNGEALAYAAAEQRELHAGDRLELVRPVAGG